MIDFKADFYSAQNIFVEIHCDGKIKEVGAVLANPSNWPFATKFYSYILHDKDTTETGELKVPHYHLLALTEKKQGKKKWLDTLQDMFPMLPREALTISVVQSERACNRYLTHIDYKDKFQYSSDSVISSNIKRYLRCLEEVKDDNPSWDTICSWTGESDIYEAVGLKNYHRAKEVWKDTYYAQERENEIDRLKGQLDALYVELHEYQRNMRATLSKVLEEVYPLSLRETDKKADRDYQTIYYAIDQAIKGE